MTRAKKSIAAFKLRAGMPIGAMVTLRGRVMYEFLDRLVAIALPRIRDFRGVSPNSFDGRGNYTLGVREQLIFPEIDYDKIDKTRGLEVTIVTTAKNDEEGRRSWLTSGCHSPAPSERASALKPLLREKQMAKKSWIVKANKAREVRSPATSTAASAAAVAAPICASSASAAFVSASWPRREAPGRDEVELVTGRCRNSDTL